MNNMPTLLDRAKTLSVNSKKDPNPRAFKATEVNKIPAPKVNPKTTFKPHRKM